MKTLNTPIVDEEEKRRRHTQFISVLAHEMKSPISAIEGYLQMIRSRSLGDELPHYDEILDRCLARIEGMRHLISDLLDLTAIESGQRRRAMTTVDLTEMARQCIENVMPDLLKRDIAIELDALEDMSMIADRTEIEMIFNNLISNAVKYNRDHGRVRVGLRIVGNEVKIRVEDTGIGMTPEECGRLFNDFSRIRNEQTRLIPGSGLGLSTLKKLAESYQGGITVKSQPGVGTTFLVTLRRNSPPLPVDV